MSEDATGREAVQGEAGLLLSALRAAQASRLHAELAAVRGETAARCALSFLPPGLFVIHFCAEWNGYDCLVREDLRGLAYLPGWLWHSSDVDREPELAIGLEVTTVPTLVAFSEGREIARRIGAGGVGPWVLVQRAEVLGGVSLTGGLAPSQSAG